MATDATDLNREAIARAHPGTRLAADDAAGQVGPQVEAERVLHRRIAGEHALLAHALGAGAALLGGLKNEPHGPVEGLLVGLQDRRRAEQHARVAIVAARVHLSILLALERHVRPLEDGQRVDVRADRDAGRVARAELGHDAVAAGAPHAAVLPRVEGPAVRVGHAERLQSLADDLACVLLAVHELWVLVQAPPQRHDEVAVDGARSAEQRRVARRRTSRRRRQRRRVQKRERVAHRVDVRIGRAVRSAGADGQRRQRRQNPSRGHGGAGFCLGPGP
mmetsp:Transcript_38755/g.121493  ORF Transcript_38755/g.121493 Transcript_38755/m.121493 type:complete len:277 (+) Transcript_38755:776-1606(+)